jgi:hypothetical protein
MSRLIITASGRRRLILSARDLSVSFSEGDDDLLEMAKKSPDAESFVKEIMPEYAKYDNEKEFLKYHYTGHIPQHAYDDYATVDGLSWLKIDRYQTLLGTMNVDGERLEFRKSNEKIKYTKIDNNGEVMRDSQGLALMMSDEEIAAKGYHIYETTIVVFNEAKQAVGLASDEWGADGIWVVNAYAKKGVGRVLLRELRKQFKSKRKIGQMTDAGQNMSLAYYRDMESDANKLRDIWRSVHPS